MKRRLLAACAATIASLPTCVLAHDIWVTPVQKDGGTIVQVRYADPAKRELPERGKVIGLEVISSTGRTSLRRPMTPATTGAPALESQPFTAPAGSILAVTYDNGFWTTDGTDGVGLNTVRPQVAKPTESWWVPKFGKTLLGPGSHTVRANTLVEFIPLSDPYSVAVGQALRVRLERKGQPLAGVKVVYGDGLEPIPEEKMPSVTTDASGVAQIPITRKGPYLITTHYVGPPSFPMMADHDDVFVSLAFDTAK